MIEVINILLKKNKEIERVRKKYDKDYKKFKPHINIVYPFEYANQEQLHSHIKESIQDTKPFKLVLKDLKKSSKDYYLYLTVDKGKKEILRIYKNLHSKILTKFVNKDMPKYTPHLTLGHFKTKKEIDNAIKNIKKQKIKYETFVDEICLLTLRKDLKIKSMKRFKLK